LPVRVLRADTHLGPAACRNLGAAAAQGEILAFIDGDCLADPDWLADLVSAFEDHAVVAVGGGVVSAAKHTLVQLYEEVRHPSQRGRSATEIRPGGSNDFLPGCNMLVRRTAFLSIGGFEESMHLGEDVDLTWRLAGSAGRIVYRPDGVVAHEHVDRLGALLRRRAVLGSSEAILFVRHPAHRRAFAVSVPQLVAATAGAASVWRWWLAPIAAAAPAIDLIVGVRSVRARGVTASWQRVAVALLKAHVSVAFRAATLLDRYFAIPIAAAAAVAVAFWSPAWLALAGLVALSLAIALAEWSRLRPELGFIPFVALNALDRAAVHAGILLGCIRHGTLLPLRLRMSLAPITLDLLRHGHATAMIESDPLFAPSRDADIAD
jgi:mycofactocin system glycosyltransferase